MLLKHKCLFKYRFKRFKTSQPGAKNTVIITMIIKLITRTTTPTTIVIRITSILITMMMMMMMPRLIETGLFGYFIPRLF
jgi:hypothetical protein